MCQRNFLARSRPLTLAGAPLNEPLPYAEPPRRPVCPVCGKPSYSKAGVHPQCAAVRMDQALTAERKEQAVETAPQAPRRPWLKSCPRCQRQLPARRVMCECGHNFDAAKHAAAGA